jgi:hypothetical protein
MTSSHPITIELIKDSEALTFLIYELSLELGLKAKVKTIRKSVALHYSLGDAFQPIGLFDNTELVGCLCITVMPSFYNDVIMEIIEQSWYVKPAYRGRKECDLLDYVEKNYKVDIMYVGAANPVLGKYLQRRGFKLSRHIWEKKYVFTEENTRDSNGRTGGDVSC